MALIWLKQPRQPRFRDLIPRWSRQIRTINARSAYAGLARTQTNIQRITQLASLVIRKVAPSGVSSMTAMWMVTILERVGWKTDVTGVLYPNGDLARQSAHWGVTLVPGLYVDP
jgi:hypothetical protein